MLLLPLVPAADSRVLLEDSTMDCIVGVVKPVKEWMCLIDD
jgi:hypothetical protein